MIVLVLIALVGATLIISRGTIFRPLQRLNREFFACPQCIGTWVGAVAGAAGLVTTGHGRAVDMFIIGSATSFLSTLADGVLVQLLGEAVDDDNTGPPKGPPT